MEARRIGKLEGFVWIGIGIFISLISWQAHVGSFNEPGPGFLGLISGLFLFCVGFAMVIPILISRIPSSYDSGAHTPFRITSWPRLAYTIGLMVAYALLLDRLGYILTTFFVMWGLFYNREKQSWFFSSLAALLCVAITYVVFEIWLHCQFPRGIFPWR